MLATWFTVKDLLPDARSITVINAGGQIPESAKSRFTDA